MRTKLDGRIRTQIENGVASGHRSMFALVGDKSRDQVPILYHILSKSTVSARPSVLWCYKKELSFSTHRQKKMKKMKKTTTISGSLPDADPFDVFISSTQIRYCYYNETEKILGNTFGVLVLQVSIFLNSKKKFFFCSTLQINLSNQFLINNMY